MIELNWESLKASANSAKNYIDIGSAYIVYVLNNYITLFCRIEKTFPASEEQLDFENNYKDVICELSFLNNGYAEVLQWSNAGVTGEENGWYFAEWDYVLPSPMFLFGGHFQSDINALFGDKVDLMIAVPGVGVVAKYVDGRFLKADAEFDIKMKVSQMKYLPAGIILRLKYYSKTQNPTVKCTLDYYFYKY